MEGTLAEVRMFAGNFAPRGWQLCNGQLLAISQWTAVFALVGTIYGGNGQTTFGMPDFRGRVALGTGNGAGLPGVVLGEMSGTPTTTLLSINLPQHNHPMSGGITLHANADSSGANADPTNRFLSQSASDIYSNVNTDLIAMNPGAITSTLSTAIAGNNSPISTQSPYLGINYIICVEGIFPSRD